MASNDFGDDVDRLLFLIGNDLVTVAAKNHGHFVPVKLEAAHAAGRRACSAFVKLHDGLELRIFDDRVLHVGDFAIVLEKQTAADARNRARAVHVDAPVNHIERMLSEVGHLPA